MGWESNNIFQVLIITGSPGSGVFVYSPTPGFGNLVASIAAVGGTDIFGNAFLTGMASYASGVPWTAEATVGSVLNFYTAPGAGGPWTQVAQVSTGSGDLLLSSNRNIVAQQPLTAPTATISSGQAAGKVLDVVNTTAAPSAATARIRAAAAADLALALLVSGDTNNRLVADSNGKLSWGTGAAAVDTDLYRNGVGILKTDGELDVATEQVTSGQANGALLTVTNTTAGDTVEGVRFVVAAAGDSWLAMRATGDTFGRMRFDTTAGGLARISFGSGTAALDVILERLAANSLGVLSADLAVDTVGRGLQVKEGANAKQGTAVLVAGTVTVANTSVTANSRIFLTGQNSSGTAGELTVSARTAGTSFTITSSSGTDTRTIAYQIFEPAP